MEYITLKSRALNNLTGNWGLSVGVALLAAMLGGLTLSTSFNLNIEGETIQDLPSAFHVLIAALISSASVINFVHFILGGTINLGYTQYLLDQYDGKELACRTLFSKFDQFGQGFLQRFGKLVQFLRAVHAFHILDQRYQMTVHFHQHVGVAQRDQLAQNAVGAGFVGLIQLEDQNAARHFQRDLMLACTGTEVRSAELLLQHAAVYVGVAGDGKAGFERSS